MIFGWILGALGGFICLVNFYTSFLRYPLFRALGGKQEDWQWVSGFPVVGSLFVGIAWLVWLRGLDSLTVDLLSWILMALDTGGLHWFLFSVTLHGMFGGKDYDD